MNKTIAALSLTLSLAAAISWSAQTAPSRSPAPNPNTSELLRQIRELRANQEQMRKELLTLKDMLIVLRGQLAERTAPPAPGPTAAGPTAPAPTQPATFDITDDNTRGNADARIVLVELSDYQCPYCGRFTRETMPQIDQNYIRTGKVKYVFHDLPLERIHANAFRAAEATYCAEAQGKYWEMHDRLFQNQNALDPTGLTLQAQALGLDFNAFSQCLNGGAHTAEVRRNLNEANAAGFRTTPSFIIGQSSGPGDRNIKVLQVVTGAQPYDVFRTAIDSALAKVSAPS
jgi:protein-disulfide isomerase